MVERKKDMRVLVIGAGGFLGQKIYKTFSESFETYGATNLETDNLYLDITNIDSIKNVLEKVKPNIVINCAGLTDVDYLEGHPDVAEKVNVGGIKNISDVCSKAKMKLIGISTDYVFDGKKGDYTEDDKPNPINVHGNAKFNEEKTIKGSMKDYIIARVSVLYGYNSPNDKQTFVNWVIKKLETGEKIRVIDDQLNTPTLIDDIASALIHLIKAEKNGIYHITGSEKISRYDFALKVAETFKLNKDLIEPIKTSDLKWKAKRPMDSSLSINKLMKEGVRMSGINEGLRRMKAQMEMQL